MQLYLTNRFYLKTNKIENANIVILNHRKTASKKKKWLEYQQSRDNYIQITIHVWMVYD